VLGNRSNQSPLPLSFPVEGKELGALPLLTQIRIKVTMPGCLQKSLKTLIKNLLCELCASAVNNSSQG
jgi:hypothetical protein